MSNYSQPKASLTALLLTYAVNNLNFVPLPYSVFCDDAVCAFLLHLKHLQPFVVRFSFVPKTFVRHDVNENRHACVARASCQEHIQVLRQSLRAKATYLQHAQEVSQSAQNAQFPFHR